MNKVSTQEDLRILEGAKLYGYSAAILGQLIGPTLIGSYLFIFYTYVVGLNAFLVSLGMSLAYIILAFCAPIMGHLIDKKKPGKFGKRRPFLLIALPIMSITLVLIWCSPWVTQFGEWNWGITAFLWIFLAVFNINYSILRAAYLSMLPEQSQTEKNRFKISSLQGIFSILATVISIFIPLIFQASLKNAQDIYNTLVDRQFLSSILPLVGLFFAIIAIILTLLAYFSTNEDFHLDKVTVDASKESLNIKQVLSSIFIPFKDKNFKKILYCIGSSTIGLRILTKSLTLVMTFVLLLKEADFITFTLPLVPFALLGFAFWNKRVATKGLKKAYIQATIIIGCVLCLTLFFVIPIYYEILLWIARIMIAIVLFCLVVGYIIPNPAISILIDNAPKDIVKKAKADSVSGMYFGSFIFILNIGFALGDLIFGIVLIGDNSTNAFFIGLLLPIAGIFYLISVIFIRKISLKSTKNK